MESLESLLPLSIYLSDGNIGNYLSSDASEEVSIYRVDGSTITNMQDMLDRISRALSFPSYFGNNLDALWDSLTDLSWLDKKPITLVIDDADIMIADNQEISVTLLEMLRDASKEWAKTIDKSSGWDKGFWREARPFKTLLLVKDPKDDELKSFLDKVAGPGDWEILTY